MSHHDRARAEAVVGILSDWADWMKGYRVRLGYPQKSAGFSSGGVVSDENTDYDYSSTDQARHRIVETCVADLPCNQSAAIHRRYLSAVYRMRDYEQSLLDAHQALSQAFVAKGRMY